MSNQLEFQREILQVYVAILPTLNYQAAFNKNTIKLLMFSGDHLAIFASWKTFTPKHSKTESLK